MPMRPLTLYSAFGLLLVAMTSGCCASPRSESEREKPYLLNEDLPTVLANKYAVSSNPYPVDYNFWIPLFCKEHCRVSVTNDGFHGSQHLSFGPCFWCQEALVEADYEKNGKIARSEITAEWSLLFGLLGRRCKATTIAKKPASAKSTFYFLWIPFTSKVETPPQQDAPPPITSPNPAGG